MSRMVAISRNYVASFMVSYRQKMCKRVTYRERNCKTKKTKKEIIKEAISKFIFFVQNLHLRFPSREVTNFSINPVGKIAEKAACRSVFLTTLHCILSAELTKTHSFRLAILSTV